jgi:hypothetical protein
MAKKFPPGRCVHCLEEFDSLTSDHVFPDSWYPDTTPENLEKWQMPACAECNKKHGRMEHDLLLRFGLCVDPSEPKSIGIAQKALRSVNPKHAKKEKDREHRGKRRDKVIRNLIPHDLIPEESIFPNFGRYEGFPPEDQPGILVAQSDLIMLGEKIVRGITYVIDGRFIEKDHKIEVFFLREDAAAPIVALIQRHGNVYECGPGIKVIRAVPEDMLSAAIFIIEIWGRLRMYAAAQPRPDGDKD